jgi:hypothetical protein
VEGDRPLFKLLGKMEEVLLDKVTTEVEQRARVEVRSLSFADEAVLPKLQGLAAEFPGAAIYLSGSLTVDLADEMVIVTSPNQLQSLVVSGETVTLNRHPLERAIRERGRQCGVGTGTTAVINSRL